MFEYDTTWVFLVMILVSFCRDCQIIRQTILIYDVKLYLFFFLSVLDLLAIGVELPRYASKSEDYNMVMLIYFII